MSFSHGGQRKGAGRKPAPYDKKTKSFRPPSPEAWEEFLSYLAGDLVEDFEIALDGLRLYAAQQNAHSTGGKASAEQALDGDSGVGVSTPSIGRIAQQKGNKMRIGQKSTCYCGKEIIWTGKYWEHTEGSFRHIAEPKKEAAEHPLHGDSADACPVCGVPYARVKCPECGHQSPAEQSVKRTAITKDELVNLPAVPAFVIEDADDYLEK